MPPCMPIATQGFRNNQHVPGTCARDDTELLTSHGDTIPIREGGEKGKTGTRGRTESKEKHHSTGAWASPCAGIQSLGT